MSGDAARTIDPEFPNLAPDVVAGYLNAPETMVAEILDGELSLMPRPRLGHARSAGRLGADLDGPFDRGRKLDIYRREGVANVWLLSPALRTLEVLRRHDLGWLIVANVAGDDVVRAEPFDAVPLDLAGLWAL